MIEAKFTFLQMPVERPFVDPAESEETRFRKAPESLNAVYMHSAAHKFILPMIDPKMFAISHINQAVVPAPSIRVDHTVQSNPPTNNRLQRGFPAVRYKLGVDLAMALENAKDDRFAVRSTSSFPLNASCPKVGFIYFDLTRKRRLGFTEFGNPFPKSMNIAVDRMAIHPRSGEPFVKPFNRRQNTARVGEPGLWKFVHDSHSGFSAS